MQKYLIILITISIITGAGCFNNNLDLKTNTPNMPQAPTSATEFGQGPIYIYVSETCQNCAVVESRVKNGLVDRKLPIIFKEISRNDDNSMEMFAVTRQCGLNLNDVGVPFLYDGQNCLQGTEKIMKYIEERMSIYNNEPK